MNIHSSFKTYSIEFKDDFDFIPKFQSENMFFVIDQNVFDLYKNSFINQIPNEQIITMQAVETKKNIEKCLELCEKFTQLPAKRNSMIVSIGGGIIQDVTGFMANILYRGIKWVFIPTTLLAICDSCIGGKTSLNYRQYKNLLGTFYPPDQIWIVPEFVQTLSELDYNSGLGEVIKFNIMAGAEGIGSIESGMDALLKRDVGVLNAFIEKSLKFKKSYIEEDEFDKGKRIYLNFAHTFGHAFETVSGYEIPHGLAVAIGMLMANRISFKRNMLDESKVMRIESIIKKIIAVKLNKEHFEAERIIDAMKKDKKQTDNSLRAILLSGDLSLQIVSDITKNEIEDALCYLFDKLS